jgi:hypothetical protein
MGFRGLFHGELYLYLYVQRSIPIEVCYYVRISLSVFNSSYMQDEMGLNHQFYER